MLRRTGKWSPWITFASGVASVAVVGLIGRLFVPVPGDSGVNCGGIGFGEVPCGWDAVGLLLIFFGVPYLGLCALLLVVAEALRRRGRWLRTGLTYAVPAVPILWALAAVLSS